jgi:hypothetical protein
VEHSCTSREARRARARALMLGLAALLIATVVALFGGKAAAAAPTICSSASTLSSGTYDALVVPTGESCMVDGVDISVLGNVVLEPGSFMEIGGLAPGHLTVGGNLIVGGDAGFTFSPFCDCEGGPSTFSVGGNVVADHPRYVAVGGTIRGNVNITGAIGGAEVSTAQIGGNVVVEDTTGSLVLVALNTVAGQVQILNNTLLGFGFNIVEGNTVTRNLTCLGNSPAPINQGIPNTVSGRVVGQCVGL